VEVVSRVASQGVTHGPSGRSIHVGLDTISAAPGAMSVVVARTTTTSVVSPSDGCVAAAASKWVDSPAETTHQCAIGTPSRSK
jgi:hypothetical protein